MRRRRTVRDGRLGANIRTEGTAIYLCRSAPNTGGAGRKKREGGVMFSFSALADTAHTHIQGVRGKHSLSLTAA